jgi:hypothetical protein
MTNIFKEPDRPPPVVLYQFFKYPTVSRIFYMSVTRSEIFEVTPEELIENEQALTKESIRRRRAC